MNKKNYYQKPTMIVVRIKDQMHLLVSTGGGDGPFDSRQQRSDWSEEER